MDDHDMNEMIEIRMQERLPTHKAVCGLDGGPSEKSRLRRVMASSRCRNCVAAIEGRKQGGAWPKRASYQRVIPKPEFWARLAGKKTNTNRARHAWASVGGMVGK